MKLDSWRARALIVLGFGLYRLWARTLRLRVEDPNDVVAFVRNQPVIFAIWHNRLLMLPRVFDPSFPTRQSFGLISASRDGDLVSILIERSGYGTIRGSSSRKGVSALRQLVDTLAGGSNVLLTPDGPRGPVYEASQGVVFLAQKTGAPVVPIHMEYSSYWRLKSWDRFIVPRPFAKLRAIFGSPLRIAETQTPQEFEAERMRLQNAIMDLVERK
ncbi:MAG TPA: lysophospholipid acyltransferase family protein [Chthoniobacterales bacterium]|nr:lysophospholipid acyltransferase family protein [Chthoniobacterales bacterium]